LLLDSIPKRDIQLTKIGVGSWVRRGWPSERKLGHDRAGKPYAGEIVRWLDDRIIAFVRTYLAVVRQDKVLRGRLAGQLAEDPVARILFPKHLASSTLERAGRTYYFVDEDTRREFELQPTSATKEVQS
jgi:YHS domain-containing protein